MSEPILPLRQWPANIPQASVPANDNALRLEALSRQCLGVESDVSTPTDGDVYLVGDTPTGAFANFEENDIALARVDEDDIASWYAWAPVDGLRITMEDGSRKVFIGESTNEWQDEGGGGGSDRTYTIVTEASAFTATPATHAGLDTYNRCGGNVTFDSAQSYAAGQAYNIRATANLSLSGTGVSLTPPGGGTLDLETDMAVQVVMTSDTTADVIGQTVPA
jgi:hypothetical protein